MKTTDYQGDINNVFFQKLLKKTTIRQPVKEISEKTNTDKGQVSKILNNKIPVSNKFLEKFSKAYNIDLSEFEDDNDVLKKNPERSKIEDQQELDSLKKLIAFKDSQIAFYEKQIAFYEANCTCVKKQQTA